MHVLGISTRKKSLIPRRLISHELTSSLSKRCFVGRNPCSRSGNKPVYAATRSFFLTYGFCIVVVSFTVVLLSIVCVPLFLEGLCFPGKEKESHITTLQDGPSNLTGAVWGLGPSFKLVWYWKWFIDLSNRLMDPKEFKRNNPAYSHSTQRHSN